MQAKTKLQQLALDKAKLTLGNQAFYALGSTVEQDDSISDARVRELMTDSYFWLMEQDEEDN